MLLECVVHTYACATAFLNEAHPEPNSCVVIDAGVPESNSLDLIEELYQRGVVMPAIVTTSGNVTECLRSAVDSLGATLLEKPYARELTAHLKKDPGARLGRPAKTGLTAALRHAPNCPQARGLILRNLPDHQCRSWRHRDCAITARLFERRTSTDPPPARERSPLAPRSSMSTATMPATRAAPDNPVSLPASPDCRTYGIYPMDHRSSPVSYLQIHGCSAADGKGSRSFGSIRCRGGGRQILREAPSTTLRRAATQMSGASGAR